MTSTVDRNVSAAASGRVLLAALSPDRSVFEGLLPTLGPVVDWPWLLERAVAHKVAALVVRRADEAGVTETLPTPVRARADGIREYAANRAARAQRTLREVGEALSKRSIPFFVIKGSVLAEHAYGNPTVRPFSDVDIVVPSSQLDTAEETLVGLGYRFDPPLVRQLGFVPVAERPRGPGEAVVPESLARTLYRRYHCHFCFSPPRSDDRLPVEIHWHVALPGVLRVRADALWEQTRTMVVAGVRVRTLDLEAMFIHVATHAMFGGAGQFRLLHLADIAWLMARFGDRYRPDVLRRLADAWEATPYLDAGLRMVGKHLRGSPSPGLAWRPRSVAARWCFDAAATARSLVGGEAPAGRLRRFATTLLREALWDMGLEVLPRRSARIAALALRARFPRSRLLRRI